jgi:hypothetical protein
MHRAFHVYPEDTIMTPLRRVSAIASLWLVLGSGSSKGRAADMDSVRAVDSARAPGSANASGSFVPRTPCLRQIDWAEVGEDQPIRILRRDGTAVSGMLRWRSYTGLGLEPLTASEPVMIADSDVAGIAYRSRGPWKSHVLAGAWIGALSGAAIGFVIGTATYDDPDPDDLLRFPESFHRTLYATAGALGGVVVGALIGYAASGEGAPTARVFHCAP